MDASIPLRKNVMMEIPGITMGVQRVARKNSAAMASSIIASKNAIPEAIPRTVTNVARCSAGIAVFPLRKRVTMEEETAQVVMGAVHPVSVSTAGMVSRNKD
jgi:hypothetical protein